MSDEGPAGAKAEPTYSDAGWPVDNSLLLSRLCWPHYGKRIKRFGHHGVWRGRAEGGVDLLGVRLDDLSRLAAYHRAHPATPTAVGEFPDRENHLIELAGCFSLKHYHSTGIADRFVEYEEEQSLKYKYKASNVSFASIASAVLAGCKVAAHEDRTEVICNGQESRMACFGVPTSHNLDFGSSCQYVVEVKHGCWVGLYKEGPVFGDIFLHLEKSRLQLLAEIEAEWAHSPWTKKSASERREVALRDLACYRWSGYRFGPDGALTEAQDWPSLPPIPGSTP